MLIVLLSAIEALSKNNSPGAVILGEYPEVGCRLITTCFVNMVFLLLSCVTGEIMTPNSPEHVLWCIFLLSTRGNFGCDVTRILGVNKNTLVKSHGA